MALADDLLAQALMLAGLDATKPKQANLRRAVSAGYYALFHLLIAACGRQFSRGASMALGQQIARAMAHGEMREVCASISSNRPNVILKALLPSSSSPELRAIATAFVLLQDARHAADYDLARIHGRAETLELLRLAQSAFHDWNRIKASEEAAIFLSALAFARRWSK